MTTYYYFVVVKKKGQDKVQAMARIFVDTIIII